MTYIKIVNDNVDTYPYSVEQLRRDNPKTSFPRSISNQALAEWGVIPVNPAPAPSYDVRTQRLKQNTAPHTEGGEWFIGWSVVDKTSEEIQSYDDAESARNRAIRTMMLGETDYLALSDSTLSPEMASYRQALRDITDHVNWPYLDEADWPVKP